ncbi:MAG: serine/threonine-protein kinase, partial [Myxococcaceae bacterium]|nr:serine/threonine-protein kinase [Myxococcaceae bacterium]
VFEGVHPIIGKRVALKVMRAPAGEALVEARRLLEEARAVNAIRHKGIVDIFGANVLADGRPYLVMELLEGQSLHQYLLAHGPLPVSDAVDLLAGLLEPLTAAHRAGVIHRDLKPTNIFVTTGTPRVKLLDFGVSRRADREPLTQPEMTLGSVGFMSPEQMSGQPVPQSDLYAVGCIAWMLLTGRPVFPARGLGELAKHHLFTRPPSIHTVRAEVAGPLARWIARLLEKQPAARPHDAGEALEHLEDVRGEMASEPTALPGQLRPVELPPQPLMAIEEVPTRQHRRPVAPSEARTIPAMLGAQRREPLPHETLGADEDDEVTVEIQPPPRKK